MGVADSVQDRDGGVDDATTSSTVLCASLYAVAVMSSKGEMDWRRGCNIY